MPGRGKGQKRMPSLQDDMAPKRKRSDPAKSTEDHFGSFQTAHSPGRPDTFFNTRFLVAHLQNRADQLVLDSKKVLNKLVNITKPE